MKRATNLQRRAVVLFVLSQARFCVVNGGNRSFSSVRVCSVGVEQEVALGFLPMGVYLCCLVCEGNV